MRTGVPSLARSCFVGSALGALLVCGCAQPGLERTESRIDALDPVSRAFAGKSAVDLTSGRMTALSESHLDVNPRLDGSPRQEFLLSPKALGIEPDAERDDLYRAVFSLVSEELGCSPDEQVTFTLSDNLLTESHLPTPWLPNPFLPDVPLPDHRSPERAECEQDSDGEYRVEGCADMGPSAPRVISAACGTDPGKRSRFFITASENTDDLDVNLNVLEMFAFLEGSADRPWEGRYRFFALTEIDESFDENKELADQVRDVFPDEFGDGPVLSFEVEPSRCEQCHLTPADTPSAKMAMTPLLNEFRKPWLHWNGHTANPAVGESRGTIGFELPEHLAQTPGEIDCDAESPSGLDIARGIQSGNCTADAFPFDASVSVLMETFEAVYADLANRRLQAARASSNPEATMGDVLAVVRPLFCSEQVNYASEFARKLGVATLIDPAFRLVYQQLPTSGSWRWLREEVLRVYRDKTYPPLLQIPTRGHSDVAVESALLASGALRPATALRVHAIDWQRPVFSEGRCALWKEAWVGEELDAPARDIDAVVLEVLASAGIPTPATDGGPLSFVAVGRMDEGTRLGGDAGAECSIEPGNASPVNQLCSTDLEAFGQILEAFSEQRLSREASGRELMRCLRDARYQKLYEQVEVYSAETRFLDDGNIIQRFSNVPGVPIPGLPIDGFPGVEPNLETIDCEGLAEDLKGLGYQPLE